MIDFVWRLQISAALHISTAFWRLKSVSCNKISFIGSQTIPHAILSRIKLLQSSYTRPCLCTQLTVPELEWKICAVKMWYSVSDYESPRIPPRSITKMWCKFRVLLLPRDGEIRRFVTFRVFLLILKLSWTLKIVVSTYASRPQHFPRD